MERILEGANIIVYDTGRAPLDTLLKEEIKWAYKWRDYYFFYLKKDTNIGYATGPVYVVNAKTKKVEWGNGVSLDTFVMYVTDESIKVTPEELRRALS